MESGFRFFCNRCSWTNLTDPPPCFSDYKCLEYKTKSHIAYQGDEVRSLYLLGRGRVRTEMVSSSGYTLSVEEMRAPYPLAAAFLFADKPYFPVDVIALEPCEVWAIDKLSVERRMATCPDFLRGFLAFSANRVQTMTQRLKIFSQKGIRARLAYYIVQREDHGYFELGRSVSSLAEHIGVERPSLSRVLSDLQREGIIEYRGGSGLIKDMEAFKELLG